MAVCNWKDNFYYSSRVRCMVCKSRR